MRESHLDAVAALETVCFASPWTREGLAQELRNPQAHFLVADADGKIVGYIGVQEICGTAYVTNIAVDPSCRRQGVGRALLCEACRGAQTRGCASITLEVRESNAPAIALYEQCGFVFVGRRKAFYREPAEDARIYTRSFEDNSV